MACTFTHKCHNSRERRRIKYYQSKRNFTIFFLRLSLHDCIFFGLGISIPIQGYWVQYCSTHLAAHIQQGKSLKERDPVRFPKTSLELSSGWKNWLQYALIAHKKYRNKCKRGKDHRGGRSASCTRYKSGLNVIVFARSFTHDVAIASLGSLGAEEAPTQPNLTKSSKAAVVLIRWFFYLLSRLRSLNLSRDITTICSCRIQCQGLGLL